MPSCTRIFIITSALLFTFTGLGCSVVENPEEAVVTFTPMAPPAGEVVSVEEVERSEDGVSVLINVEVNNEVNPRQLPLTWAEYSITVDGLGTYTGVAYPNATAPEEDKIRMQLPAAFASSGSIEGRNFQVSGAVTYRPPGRFWIWVEEEGWGLPSSAFTGSGTIVRGERVITRIDVEVDESQLDENQDPGILDESE